MTSKKCCDGSDKGLDCINRLLCYAPSVTIDYIGELMTIGRVLYWAHMGYNDSKGKLRYHSIPRDNPYFRVLGDFGLKVFPTHFLVSNNHYGLDVIYDGTEWEGGAWRIALTSLLYCRDHGPRKFKGSGSTSGVQRSVWIPWEYIRDFISWDERPLQDEPQGFMISGADRGNS